MNLGWKNEYYRYRRYFVNFRKTAGNTKVYSFAWLSLTIFTVVFFTIVAIRPTLVTIAKLNKEIKDKREASQKLQAKINAIVAAQEEYAKYANHIPLLDEAIPQKSEFPRLAQFLEEYSTSTETNLQSLNFEIVQTSGKAASKITSPTRSLNFTISLAGDYFKLKEFLEVLESSRRIIKMEQSSFGQSKKEGETNLLLRVSGQASYKEKP